MCVLKPAIFFHLLWHIVMCQKYTTPHNYSMFHDHWLIIDLQSYTIDSRDAIASKNRVSTSSVTWAAATGRE